MSQIHAPDTQDHSKALKMAERSANQSIKDSYATTFLIAMLAQKLIGLIMRGGGALLGRNRDRDRDRDSSLLDNARDVLDRRGKKKAGRSLTQRLGNKARGLLRNRKLGKVANLGKNTGKAASNLSKTTKMAGNTAKAAKTTKNAIRASRAAKNAVNIAKTARFVKTTSNVAKTAKLAKTAHTAYKLGKIAKLANVGRIAVTGGAALAGGPVGIALLVGSVVAPIAIEKVWKNREQIYNGGKNLIDKSQLAAKDVSAIIRGKNAQVGEVVEGAENLKITGDDKSTLLETDDKGKVVANNFDPQQKLAFFQQKQGESTMLLDEADLNLEGQVENQNQTDGSSVQQNAQANTTIELDKNVELPSPPLEASLNSDDRSSVQQDTQADSIDLNRDSPLPPPPMLDEADELLDRDGQSSEIAPETAAETGISTSKQVGGMSVVKGSLQQLRQNNPNNSEIAQQTNFLEQGLDEAKSAQQANLGTSGVKQSIQLNEAGSSIINLFNLEQPAGQRNQPLETEDYSISRRGKDYFLKDKEGNTLLQATNTAFGTKIKSSNLSTEQIVDLSYLKQDLRLGEGITGGFMPAKSPPQMSQSEPNDVRAPQSSPNKTQQRSAFSQYLENEKVPVAAGNTKQKSSEMER